MRLRIWWMAILAACGTPSDPTVEPGVADRDGDGFAAGQDCDDGDPTVHPGADDLCNGVDDDCSGAADDDPSRWPGAFDDADGDGFGVPRSGCELRGSAAVGGDCDDGDAAVHPEAGESCDLADDDCDGLVDDADPDVDASTWYADDDGDGFGDPAVSATACAAPPGYVADATDCAPADPGAFPGALDVCNGVDDDCSGLADDDPSTWLPGFADADGDGFGSEPSACDPTNSVPAGGDCDDGDASVNPDATESCNLLDDDCDGLADDDDPIVADPATWYEDLDADGYGDPAVSALACAAPAGFVADGTDCAPVEPLYHAVLSWWPDGDGDGAGDPAFAPVVTCVPAPGSAPTGDDCDDADAEEVPGADWHPDADLDGYGDAETVLVQCERPADWLRDGSDCADADPDVHPGATELCNGVDDDCEPYTYEAAELDGVGYLVIQDAIDAAAPGDTVLICDGFFRQHVEIDRDLTLTSANGRDTTTLDGRGLYPPISIVDGAAVELSGLTIRNGSGTAGGAVDASLGGPLTLTDCRLEESSATDGGAVAATSLVAVATEFTSNTADVTGGAIAVDGDGAVALTDCAFVGNAARFASGGAVFGGTLTLTRTTFEGNTAMYGGAVAVFGGDHVADAETRFEGNDAFAGGALWFAVTDPSRPSASWTGGTFTGNHGGSAGAISANAVTLADSSLSISDVVVEDNVADLGAGGIGLSGYAASLTNATIRRNTALIGGGLYLSNHPAEPAQLVGVVVEDNTATMGGGGIAVWSQADVVLDGCTVLRNTAATGGAVSVDAGSIVTSVSSEFGAGADDNAPNDVDVDGAVYGYSSAASFTCDGATASCL